jgi:hypothetical protein
MIGTSGSASAPVDGCASSVAADTASPVLWREPTEQIEYPPEVQRDKFQAAAAEQVTAVGGPDGPVARAVALPVLKPTTEQLLRFGATGERI